MKSGEILLVNYPFTDDSGSKVRPVLVVSSQQYNQGEDIVIVPISSVSDPSDKLVFPVKDVDKYFPQTGLRKTSYVKWTKPITISKQCALRRLGYLPSKPLAEIQSKIKTLFDQ